MIIIFNRKKRLKDSEVPILGHPKKKKNRYRYQAVIKTKSWELVLKRHIIYSLQVSNTVF